MQEHGQRDLALAGGLAALAGFVDAIGFIKIGGFFVAFMSGNTTLAGVSLAEGRFWDFAQAGGLIAAFVAGVVGGSILGRLVRRRQSAVMLAVAALLATAALAYLDPRAALLAPPLLAAAMGAENAVFERDGEVTIGLTYMTGTLVKLGQAVARALSGEPATEWRGYFLLWAGLSIGSIMGGTAFTFLGLWALWIAVCFAVAAALLMRLRERSATV
ncbi:YoaK family protein [Tomitella biformata]|uniref:YoaK family protein n=1 Tax=Tomitella biformata TaxID=630403 RepID=UPI0004679EF4|nr:YoaK family protein [Tomitella biformata]